jgi:hypothetical protein
MIVPLATHRSNNPTMILIFSVSHCFDILYGIDYVSVWKANNLIKTMKTVIKNNPEITQ